MLNIYTVCYEKNSFFVIDVLCWGSGIGSKAIDCERECEAWSCKRGKSLRSYKWDDENGEISGSG